MAERLEGGGGSVLDRRYVLDLMHGHKSWGHRPSHTYNAGTEHVGFSPTRKALLVPSAKRREVGGESHEG